jgi:organic hydroperoxide reductase OsmC/OhrA
MTDEGLTVGLQLERDYQFEVDFGVSGAPLLVTDASPPLGKGAGPDSERLLLAAVANCLSSSLLFSLRKFKNDSVTMRTKADGSLVRNEHGRLRMGRIEVEIRLGAAAADLRQLDRALAQFEDFCVVTQSVRAAIPVGVKVFDSDGTMAAG